MVDYDPALTINFVGDLHHGRTPLSRMNMAKADLIATTTACAHRVYLGDLTDYGPNAGYRALAYAFMHDIAGSFDYVYGNHDYGGITVTALNAEWGDYVTLNWVRDLPFCRIIGVNNDTITDGDKPCTLSPATIDWLGDRMAETALPCLIATHAPLGNTVSSWYTSFFPFFQTQPDADFRAVLAAHSNARMVISGHTHSKYDAAGMVSRVPLGGTRIIAMNAGAIAYVAETGPSYTPEDSLDDVLCSPFLTFHSDRVQIRWRDHAAGTWFDAPTTEMLYTIPPPPEGYIMGPGHAPVIISDRGLSVGQRSALGASSDWNAALVTQVTSDTTASGGPLAIYDAPLSDARRALVNTAIDNGDDLWTLFEEWEGIIDQCDLLALQSGEATAGVTAELAPIDLLPLQSGRATAGVTAQVEALELPLNAQPALAVGLTGSNVIPAGRP